MPRTSRGALTLSETAPVSRRRRRLVRTLVVALVPVLGVAAYLGWRGTTAPLTSQTCQAAALSHVVELDPEQMANASTIVGIAMKRGLPARAATIAVTTALQESKLRNLRYGDRDSLGLFQQRQSQGWGTAAQILDPVYATNRFYDELVKIKGYQTMSITAVAQKVQRSAYPTAYAAHETEGRILASTLSGYDTAAFGCRLDAPAGSANQGALETALHDELGRAGHRSNDTFVVTADDARTAWAVAAWAVAKASPMGLTSVKVGGRQWVRSTDTSAWHWQDGPSGSPVTVVIGLA